jgi:maltooligosyltrehalose trehalohydrolase
MTIGPDYLGEGICRFTVWAPVPSLVELRLLDPQERTVPMTRDDRGYWRVEVDGLRPGTRYFFRLDGRDELPDPASHSQPDGVHGPSAVVDHAGFAWQDSDWHNPDLEEQILYELHVGSFTSEGTFEAIIPRLDALQELGVTGLSLMPVAQFPGSRNWGYDGVCPFAVQNSYGGPEGLKTLVDACHRRGLAVILDVVYNHLGPEGNYLARFAPYFTDTYTTPWGPAVNVDGADSDEVRGYFLDTIRHWYERYHLDGLRLDAVHAIVDMSAHPFLQQMAEQVESLTSGGKPFHLIAESDLNDSRIVRARDCGGLGHRAQWNDDFHHALHALLTGERDGYYLDFGRCSDLEKAFSQNYVYDGRYSEHRRRSHGNSAADLPPSRFVVYSQTHDQVGNRMRGERLSALVSFDKLKLAAGAVLLSPFVPMLFMGQEYGEQAPFLYFVSHGDQELVQAVRRGRAEEFRAFGWTEEPPDPQDEATWRGSILNWHQREHGRHGRVLAFYRELLRLRRQHAGLRRPNRTGLQTRCWDDQQVLAVTRGDQTARYCLAMNFGSGRFQLEPGREAGQWLKLLDSADTRWDGPGSAIPERLSGSQTAAIEPASFVLWMSQGSAEPF